jgi:hypothetical protein
VYLLSYFTLILKRCKFFFKPSSRFCNENQSRSPGNGVHRQKNNFKLTNGGVQIIILMMNTQQEDKEVTGKIDVDKPHDSVVQRFLRNRIGLPGDAGQLFDEQRR